jgi:hypothetical protein
MVEDCRGAIIKGFASFCSYEVTGCPWHGHNTKRHAGGAFYSLTYAVGGCRITGHRGVSALP